MAKKRESSGLKKAGVAVVVVVVALVLSWQLGLFKKDCKEDRECFNSALKRCRQAKFFELRDYNYYGYVVKGSKKGSCVVNVKMEKMAEGTSVANLERFGGKAMDCSFPKGMMNETTIDNVQGMLGYCSGPLKEGIYELIIEKLYGIVLNNIGDVVVEFREVLKEAK